MSVSLLDGLVIALYFLLVAGAALLPLLRCTATQRVDSTGPVRDRVQEQEQEQEREEEDAAGSTTKLILLPTSSEEEEEEEGDDVYARGNGHQGGEEGRGRRDDDEGYFLAGRETGWFALGCSLFASNIGSEHFVGLAASGSVDGIAAVAGEWTSAYLILVLAFGFLPYYLFSRVVTMPQFVEKRYGKNARLALTIVSLVLYILARMCASLYACGVLLEAVAGWSPQITIPILAIPAALYTAWGGLGAVIRTEVLQVFVLLFGTISVVILGMQRVGGLDELRVQLPSKMFNFFQPDSHANFPWTGVAFGYQVIVQRVLSAKSEIEGQWGCILSGYMKISPLFLMVFPGMIARALYPSEVASNPNSAFPLLVQKLLPSGLLGLMIAAMFAALMSSIASVLNSAATLITVDLVGNRVSPRRRVWVGRLSCLGVTLLSLLVVPFIPLISNQLYIYTHKVMSYFAPPIAVIFVNGLLWWRFSERSGLCVLIYGFIVGLLRFALEIAVHSSSAEFPPFLDVFARSNFLNFVAVFAPSCIVVQNPSSYEDLVVFRRESCVDPSLESLESLPDVASSELYVKEGRDDHAGRMPFLSPSPSPKLSCCRCMRLPLQWSLLLPSVGLVSLLSSLVIYFR